MMKKFVAIFLFIAMLLSLFSCGPGGDTDSMPAQNNSVGESTASEAPTGDSSSEENGGATGSGKLKVTVVTSALTDNVAEFQFMKDVAQKANVEVEWEQVVENTWAEKKSVQLASGDIADVLLGLAISNGDIANFTSLFAPLNDLIDERAPNVTKMFEEKPETLKMSMSLDGNIYGIAKYQRFWPNSGDHQMINQTWLDKLNLKAPTTFDELFEVLKAFKENDPNGNGIADEVPMDWAPTGAEAAGINGFNPLAMLGGFGVTANYLNGEGYYVDNGVVKNYYQHEGFYEVVSFLHKCWAEGLINPEVFTQDYSQFQALSRGAGDDVGIVGFTYGWDANDRFGAVLADQYVSVGVLKPTPDYSGPISWDYEYNEINYMQNAFVVSAACEDKAAAMRLCNEFYDSVMGIQVLFGSMGLCIEDNGDGTYAVLPPADESLDPGTWKWTNALADKGPMYISDDIELQLPTDMQKINELEEVYQDAYANIDLETDVWPRAFIKFTQEDESELTLIHQDMGNVIRDTFANWVMNGVTEEDFQNHLSNIENAGVNRAIEIMQKQYDIYMAE